MDSGIQTDPVPEVKKHNEMTMKRNLELEEEVFRLKEELFDANNKVKVLTQ